MSWSRVPTTCRYNDCMLERHLLVTSLDSETVFPSKDPSLLTACDTAAAHNSDKRLKVDHQQTLNQTP